MANADRPEGFRPHGQINRLQTYESGSAIAIGDMVKKASDGQVDPVATGGASHSTAVLGVAMSQATAAGQDVWVCDDPDQEYFCQGDDNSIAADTDIGLNVDILGTDPVGGQSRQEADTSAKATTATLPLKIKRLAREVSRDAYGTNAGLIVKINAHQSGSGTDGV